MAGAAQYPRGAAQARADAGFGQRPILYIALFQARDAQRIRALKLQPHPARAAGVAVVPLAFQRTQIPISRPRCSAADGSAPAAPRSAPTSATEPPMPARATTSEHSARY